MASIERMREPLQRYLAARLAAGAGLRLAEFERITAGHSRAMFRVTAEWCEDGHPASCRLALRVEQGGVFGTGSLAEVRTMRALRAAGVAVARVRCFEPDASVLGFPFFVMDWVEGSSGPPDHDTLVAYITLLHRLHSLDWRAAGLRFACMPAVPLDGVLMEIARWESVYRSARLAPVPLLEEGAAWLRHHAPRTARLAVVHGDPGPGNFIHRGGEVAAFTDWEFCHLGDPAEDWSFLATMRGAALMPPDAWAALIEEVTGTVLDPSEWRYWEVFNQFKGACANITALRAFVSGDNPAPNMAAIGTALHLRMVQRIAGIIGQDQTS